MINLAKIITKKVKKLKYYMNFLIYIIMFKKKLEMQEKRGFKVL